MSKHFLPHLSGFISLGCQQVKDKIYLFLMTKKDDILYQNTNMRNSMKDEGRRAGAESFS